MRSNIGEIIRKKRQDAGLTQAELAERMGLRTKSGVCRLERGDWKPSLSVVERAAKALRCSPLELLEWESDIDVTDELTLIMSGLTQEKKRMLLEFGRFLKSQDRDPS